MFSEASFFLLRIFKRLRGGYSGQFRAPELILSITRSNRVSFFNFSESSNSNFQSSKVPASNFKGFSPSCLAAGPWQAGLLNLVYFSLMFLYFLIDCLLKIRNQLVSVFIKGGSVRLDSAKYEVSSGFWARKVIF